VEYGFTIDKGHTANQRGTKPTFRREQGFTLKQDKHSGDYLFGFCIPEPLADLLLTSYDEIRDILQKGDFCSFVRRRMGNRYIKPGRPTRCWRMESRLDTDTLTIKEQTITHPVVVFEAFDYDDETKEIQYPSSVSKPLSLAYELTETVLNKKCDYARVTVEDLRTVNHRLSGLQNNMVAHYAKENGLTMLHRAGTPNEIFRVQAVCDSALDKNCPQSTGPARNVTDFINGAQIRHVAEHGREFYSSGRVNALGKLIKQHIPHRRLG